MKKNNFTMFVVKLGTPSRANYEHFHVYLAYGRQTGTVVTRQTYDRAPRLTRPPTAHISRGGHVVLEEHYCFLLLDGTTFHVIVALQGRSFKSVLSNQFNMTSYYIIFVL